MQIYNYLYISIYYLYIYIIYILYYIYYIFILSIYISINLYYIILYYLYIIIFIILYILSPILYLYFIIAILAGIKWYFTLFSLAFPWSLLMLNIFHISIGHLFIFFEVVTIWIICPFLYQIIHLLVIKL